MEEQRFEELTRLIATKTSRRQVLKVLAGATVGGLVGSRLSPVLAAGAGNCARYCNQIFGEDTAATTQCIRDSKRGTGLCYTCGPASTGGGTPCGPTSGGYYTSYSSTTCCSGSTPACSNGTCAAPCVQNGQQPPGADKNCCEAYDATTNFCVSCVPNGDMPSTPDSCCSGRLDTATQTCVSCVRAGVVPYPNNPVSCCSGASDSGVCV
jgi:hypothetical protein